MSEVKTYKKQSQEIAKQSKNILNSETVAKIQSLICFAFPSLWQNIESSEISILLYDSLKDLSDYQVYNATKKMIRSTKQLYPNSNIIAIIRELAFDFEDLPLVSDAWKKVRELMSKSSVYDFPSDFSHEIIERTIKAIGWRDLCTSENIEATRAHFFKIFEAEFQRYKTKKIYGDDFF